MPITLLREFNKYIYNIYFNLQIIIWDPQHLRSLHTLPTLGGFAYSLAISPLDPGTLGIGVGDNMLRVWQTASSVGPYEALVLWQGIKSKVMVVRMQFTCRLVSLLFIFSCILKNLETPSGTVIINSAIGWKQINALCPWNVFSLVNVF